MATVSGEVKKIGRRKRRSKIQRNSISNEINSWEIQREKQKLITKLEIEKDLLEQEKKKAKKERAEVEKKRQLYLKQKAMNDRLVIKYEVEKALWMARKKKKGHHFNRDFFLNQLTGEIKEWGLKAEDAKQGWMDVKTARAEIKELKMSLVRDQEQLKTGQAEFDKQKMEFQVKSRSLEEDIKANESERERLKVLENPLLEEERKLARRIKHYQCYDSIVRDRENRANWKEAEQNKERAWLENLKHSLFATLEHRKASFNQQSTQLYEQITEMDDAFGQIFAGVSEKVEEPDLVIL